MNTADDRIRQLLVETVDHELGSRLDVPAREDQLRDVATGKARRRWAIPLAAAAAVIVIVGGTFGIVAVVSPGHDSAPAGPSGSSVVVTCAGPKGSDASRDTAALTARAGALAKGRVTSFASGNSISVTIPGAKRAEVANLCASTGLNFQPLVAPAVPDPAGRTHDPLGRLGFRIPATETAYDRLSSADRTALATALARSDCRPGTIIYRGTYHEIGPNGTSSAPQVVCTGGKGDGYSTRVAALVGAPIVSSADIADATAIGPDASNADSEWVVSLQLTAQGARAFATFTTAYNTGSDTVTAGATSCGATTTACSDFVAFVTDGRIVSIPVTQSPIVGGSVQIAGAFTEASAKALAASARLRDLPVPLTLTSISAGR